MLEFRKKTVGFVNQEPVTLLGKSPRGTVFAQTAKDVHVFDDPGIAQVEAGHYLHDNKRGDQIIISVCDCVQPKPLQ